MKGYVRSTGKDGYGDITSLCNRTETWSPRLKANAIRDIESGIHEYWVNWANFPETQVHVVVATNGTKYLRTDRDSTTQNNLDDLPDCERE